MKTKALFIHGFNGTKNSSTGKVVSKVLEKYNIETITENFDLLDVEGTLKKIDNIIIKNNITLLVGTSLGGFYTLAYDGIIDKIVINPCMEPSIEIPKLDGNVSDETMEGFLKYEDFIYDESNNINTRAVFGTKDELFGDKFQKVFATFYGSENGFTFDGGHHGANGAEDAIEEALKSLNIISNNSMFDDEDDIPATLFHRTRESHIRETFVNLFPKEKPTDQNLKQDIYNMFVEGYSNIGGLAGGETIEKFYNKADMIKINKKDGKIAAACVYRFDKGGRKLVYCTANKNHPKGKDALIQIMKNDIKMSVKTNFWAEVSEQPLHMYIKYANAPVINADEMKKYMDKEAFLDIDVDKDLDHIDPKFRDEYKQAYVRQLGDGKYHTKVGVGTLPSENVFESLLTKCSMEDLEERAIEIDANGKPYAVQDTYLTRKTHDATGDKDIFIKNGQKDPNLTASEKDVVRKSAAVLKQMGKIKDISKEFNVSHGPDLVYIPIEDKVKVTPDNGSAPYKIKIPEAVRPILSDILKPYDYDLLDDICAVLNKDLVDECKEAIETKFKITETITGREVRKYGYLENEAVLFRISE